MLSASPLWCTHFLLPPNGPEELRSQTHFLDYQGAASWDASEPAHLGLLDLRAPRRNEVFPGERIDIEHLSGHPQPAGAVI